MAIQGYEGSVLKVDLSVRSVSEERIAEAVMKKYVGGTGLGAKFLYEQVGPGVEWNDPANIVFMGTGPLGGTIGGTGIFSVVTKGPQTNGGVSTQSNGYFGAFLRLSGFHGVLICGRAEDWVYLYIHDGTAEIRDARHLTGIDTWDIAGRIAADLAVSENQISVYSIGVAGENLVRFASLVGDKGHVASHGGTGAVLGSKKLKAVVVKRGRGDLEIRDREALKDAANRMHEFVKTLPLYEWGTSKLFPNYIGTGILPVRNLTAADFPAATAFGGPEYRPRLDLKRHPCWACSFRHCHIVTIKEGPYAGLTADEPEYEDFAAFGSQIYQLDPMAVIALSDLNDRLGMDANEAGWLLGMVMECYERGILSRSDTDGIEMNWGDVAAVRAMLAKIAAREGFGNVLAEGTLRASRAIGGEAPEIGVYIRTGAVPRGHDHRARWEEMLDTATSSTSTVDSLTGFNPPQLAGIPPSTNPFDAKEVARVVAGTKGRHAFEDSLAICAFTCRSCQPVMLTDALNAVTGWDWKVEDVPRFGSMVSNLMRCFDVRHGRRKEDERPSPRYSSAPGWGHAKGIAVAAVWDEMQERFYGHMGWDLTEGRPLPETLQRVGLNELIGDMWSGPQDVGK